MVVDKKLFDKAMHTSAGHNAIINLKFGDKSDKVIVKEIQRYPIDDSIIHVDFQRISLTEKIEVMVPVHVKGTSKGVEEKGGVLEHLVREVRVKCLPTNIPPDFIIDVTNLDIGEGIAISQIPLEEGVEVLHEGDLIVINVVASTKEEEKPVVEEEAAAAEPEVISKGKKEEEGTEAEKPQTKAEKPAAKTDKGA